MGMVLWVCGSVVVREVREGWTKDGMGECRHVPMCALHHSSDLGDATKRGVALLVHTHAVHVSKYHRA
eukprot:1138987-Pelagomonas_calceolata.AAC.10